MLINDVKHSAMVTGSRRSIVFSNIMMSLFMLAICQSKDVYGQNMHTPRSTVTASNMTSPSMLSTLPPTLASTSKLTTQPSTPKSPSTTWTSSPSSSQKATRSDIVPSVRLLVTGVLNQVGFTEMVLGFNAVKALQTCVCNPRNSLCQVSHQNVTINTKLPESTYSNFYICSLSIGADMICRRISVKDASPPCRTINDYCVPNFTAFGSDCELKQAFMAWRSDQQVTVQSCDSGIDPFFKCNVTDWSADQITDDDDGDDDIHDDDTVNPVIIGVVVAVGVVLVVIFLTIIVVMVHARRKALSGQRSSQQVFTDTSSEEGQLRIASPQSSLEGSNPSSSLTGGYTVSSISSMKSGLNGQPTTSRGSISQESNYIYIDDNLVNTKGEYSTLDDATQYKHVYKKASQQFDPRLRPPLPLPKERSSEPLPYYSMAKSFSETPDSDMVSGQYLELIGDGSSTGHLQQSGDLTVDSGTRDLKNLNISNKHDYFELEKE